MTYIAFGSMYGQEKALHCGNAKNKAELREKVLRHPLMQVFSSIQYGKRKYSMSDIYAGR